MLTNNTLCELLQRPIIAVVRRTDELEAALSSPAAIIELRASSLIELPQIVMRCREAGKALFLYPELLEGLGHSAASIEFLTRYARPTGIVSTKKQILNTAASLGLLTVYQIFMIDTQAFGTGVRNAQKIHCDAIEVMPGAIPNIVREVCTLIDKPVLCAGLVKTSEEIRVLLEAGARGIATSTRSLLYDAANGVIPRTPGDSK